MTVLLFLSLLIFVCCTSQSCNCFYYLELPTLRKSSETYDERRRSDPMTSCRVAFIKWIANFTHALKRGETGYASTAPPNRCVPVSSHSQALSQLHSQAQAHSLHPSIQSYSSAHLSTVQTSHLAQPSVLKQRYVNSLSAAQLNFFYHQCQA